MLTAFVAVPDTTSSHSISTLRQQAKKAGIDAMFTTDFFKLPLQDRFNQIRQTVQKADIVIGLRTPYLGETPAPDVTFWEGYGAGQKKQVLSCAATTEFERTLAELNLTAKSQSAPVIEKENTVYLAGPGVGEAHVNKLKEHYSYLEGIVSAAQSDAGVLESVRMGLFNCTPPQGIWPDSTIVSNMGYLFGKDDRLGRLPMVFAYSSVSETMLARVNTLVTRGIPGATEALNQYSASERIACHVVYSPMIDCALQASGCSLTHRPSLEIVNRRGFTSTHADPSTSDFLRCTDEMARKHHMNGVLADRAFALLKQPVQPQGFKFTYGPNGQGVDKIGHARLTASPTRRPEWRNGTSPTRRNMSPVAEKRAPSPQGRRHSFYQAAAPIDQEVLVSRGKRVNS
ncbi:MAG: hypothetical protein NTW08_02590 [Gammaproteobacteria bacterium]|nr:hypothetical protein [Gammaproteobacteria bacterium]